MYGQWHIYNTVYYFYIFPLLLEHLTKTDRAASRLNRPVFSERTVPSPVSGMSAIVGHRVVYEYSNEISS